MSNYRTLGVLNPSQKLKAVFYEGKELERYPVIGLMVIECQEEESTSIVVEPLTLSRKTGEILPANEAASYLGVEEKGKKKDWTQEIKRREDFRRDQEIDRGIKNMNDSEKDQE